jgi:hypothetical protein
MKAPSGNVIEEILANTKSAKELMAHIIVGNKVNTGAAVEIDGGKYQVRKIGFYSSNKSNKAR